MYVGPLLHEILSRHLTAASLDALCLCLAERADHHAVGSNTWQRAKRDARVA